MPAFAPSFAHKLTCVGTPSITSSASSDLTLAIGILPDTHCTRVRNARQQKSMGFIFQEKRALLLGSGGSTRLADLQHDARANRLAFVS